MIASIDLVINKGHEKTGILGFDDCFPVSEHISMTAVVMLQLQFLQSYLPLFHEVNTTGRKNIKIELGL